jgi:hypothetical protein
VVNEDRKMDILESLCRIMTVADGVDPDKETVGLGKYLPKGQTCKLWEARKVIAHKPL